MNNTYSDIYANDLKRLSYAFDMASNFIQIRQHAIKYPSFADLEPQIASNENGLSAWDDLTKMAFEIYNNIESPASSHILSVLDHQSKPIFYINNVSDQFELTNEGLAFAKPYMDAIEKQALLPKLNKSVEEVEFLLGQLTLLQRNCLPDDSLHRDSLYAHAMKAFMLEAIIQERYPLELSDQPLQSNEMLPMLLKLRDHLDELRLAGALPYWQEQTKNAPFGADKKSTAGMFNVTMANGKETIQSFSEATVIAALLKMTNEGITVPKDVLGSFGRNLSIKLNDQNKEFAEIMAQTTHSTDISKIRISEYDLLDISSALKEIADHIESSVESHRKGPNTPSDLEQFTLGANSAANLRETADTMRRFVALSHTLPTPMPHTGMTYKEHAENSIPKHATVAVIWEPRDPQTRKKFNDHLEQFFTQARALEPLTFKIPPAIGSRISVPNPLVFCRSHDEANRFMNSLPDESFHAVDVKLTEDQRLQLSTFMIQRDLHHYNPEPKMKALLWKMANTPLEIDHLPTMDQLRIYANSVNMYIPEKLQNKVHNMSELSCFNNIEPIMRQVSGITSPEEQADINQSVAFGAEYSKREMFEPAAPSDEPLKLSTPKLTR